uniref:Pyridoxal-phosphate dependent enzyme n=1 Tax=Fervidicoccus fontis TaxID=683846 RepID=A0A7J3ZJC3_9CREN
MFCNSEVEGALQSCPYCSGPLEVKLERRWSVNRGLPSMWRYETMLPRPPRRLTLNEGFTPILRLKDVVIKNETRNPTRTYADRGSSLLASFAKREHYNVFFEPDAGLSLVTYLLRAGCSVSVYVELERVSIHELLAIAAQKVSVLFSKPPSKTEVLRYDNPLMLEGLKTLAYEIYEQVGLSKGIVVPGETGTLAIALARGFETLEELGLISYVPEIVVSALEGRSSVLGHVASRIRGIRICEVSSRDALQAMLELARAGLYVRLLSATAYLTAKRLGSDYLAVLTSSEYREPQRLRVRGDYTPLQRLVLRVLEERCGEWLTAYEVWKLIGGPWSLRGVYKALSSLERKGAVVTGYKALGLRKTRVYAIASST